MRRSLHTWVPHAWLLAATVAVLQSSAEAALLYTVTDLGQANPDVNYSGYTTGSGNETFNYLSLLTPPEQQAFQAGSFDSIAHPVPLGDQPSGVTVLQTNGLLTLWGSGVTENNLGVQVGYGTEEYWPESRFWWPLVSYNPTTHTLAPYSLPFAFEGFWGNVTGINDNGTIIGSIENNSTSSSPNAIYQIPFVRTSSPGYEPGDTPTQIGSLGGDGGVAMAINNGNQVVGWSTIADGTHHAFLYQNGVMLDLNSFIPSSSGIVLYDAVGINASG
jgi:probable HAF family extracellular repeat protein